MTNDLDFARRYGSWAVIIGGSYGVGASFARQLAERGLNLILSARSLDTLEAFAADLRRDHPGRTIETVAADMTLPDGIGAVIAAAEGREVGLFIHNAGAGSRLRGFVGGDLAYDQGLVALNVTSKMALVHHFGAAMRDRGRGGILLCESTSGLAGNPGLASYSGVKAFGRVFAEALWHELKGDGVHVLSLVLGLTATPSNARNFPESAGQGMSPDDVASEGLARLADGPVHFPGPYAEKARLIRAMDYGEAVQAAFDRSGMFREGDR